MSLPAEQAVDAEPFGQSGAPAGERWIERSQTDSVPALFIDMHLGGHLRLAEREVENHAIFRWHHGIGIRVKEESRRRLRGDLFFVRKQFN